MLFLAWRNEESLYGSLKTYEEYFKAKKMLITPVRIKYEQYNDVLEEAIEEVEQEELEGVNDSEGEDINERLPFTTDADDYGFFYPDRPQEYNQYDIGHDMGLNVRYAMEVDCSCGTMQDKNMEANWSSVSILFGNSSVTTSIFFNSTFSKSVLCFAFLHDISVHLLLLVTFTNPHQEIVTKLSP